jgi:hypothetical protein
MENESSQGLFSLAMYIIHRVHISPYSCSQKSQFENTFAPNGHNKPMLTMARVFERPLQALYGLAVRFLLRILNQYLYSLIVLSTGMAVTLKTTPKPMTKRLAHCSIAVIHRSRLSKCQMLSCLQEHILFHLTAAAVLFLPSLQVLQPIFPFSFFSFQNFLGVGALGFLDW